MEYNILFEKVVWVVESAGRKLHYFCGDFQDYELLRTAWRQVAIIDLLNNPKQNCIFAVLLYQKKVTKPFVGNRESRL